MGIERSGLKDVVVGGLGVFAFDGSQSPLDQASQFDELAGGAFLEGRLMFDWQDRAAVGETRCEWAQGDEGIGLGDDPLVRLDFFFEHIASVASAMGLKVLVGSQLGFEYIGRKEIGADQLAMGMDQGSSCIGPVVFKNHRIAHCVDASPVPQSLLVSFEDQSGVFGRQLSDALDVVRGFDDHFMPAASLFSEEQIRVVGRGAMGGSAKGAFVGRIEGGEFVRDDPDRPIVGRRGFQNERWGWGLLLVTCAKRALFVGDSICRGERCGVWFGSGRIAVVVRAEDTVGSKDDPTIAKPVVPHFVHRIDPIGSRTIPPGDFLRNESKRTTSLRGVLVWRRVLVRLEPLVVFC